MREIGTLLAAAFLAACLCPAQPAEASHGFPCRLGRYFRPSLGVCQGHPYRSSALRGRTIMVPRLAAARPLGPIRIRVVTRTVYVHDRPLPPTSLRAEQSNPAWAVPQAAAGSAAVPAAGAAPGFAPPGPPPPTSSLPAEAPPAPAAAPSAATWAGSLNLHPDWITPRPAAP